MSKNDWERVGSIYAPKDNKNNDDGPGPTAIIVGIIAVVILMASCAG